ncbi:hypothetical protein TIFTF001_032295 [Ficus carica]|uniref:Uncharacterized protein n=1 Tax=Ficus carica TaxID=3494 RepID=A0AA88DWZ2_FICCA|nr:hypothetical protein TIFTF001_032295 [Ficus carica]
MALQCLLELHVTDYLCFGSGMEGSDSDCSECNSLHNAPPCQKALIARLTQSDARVGGLLPALTCLEMSVRNIFIIFLTFSASLSTYFGHKRANCLNFLTASITVIGLCPKLVLLGVLDEFKVGPDYLGVPGSFEQAVLEVYPSLVVTQATTVANSLQRLLNLARGD